MGQSDDRWMHQYQYLLHFFPCYFFVLLVLCPVIRLFYPIESQTWWNKSWRDHFALSWSNSKVNGKSWDRDSKTKEEIFFHPPRFEPQSPGTKNPCYCLCFLKKCHHASLHRKSGPVNLQQLCGLGRHQHLLLLVNTIII